MNKLFKATLAAAFILSVTACAIAPTQVTTWSKQGVPVSATAATREAYEDADRQCQYDSIRTQHNADVHMGIFGQALEANMFARKIYMACMRSRNYTAETY